MSKYIKIIFSQFLILKILNININANTYFIIDYFFKFDCNFNLT